MGYLKTPETDELVLPSDPTYHVIMKRRATFGDTSAASAAMIHAGMTSATGQAASNGGAPDIEAIKAQVMSQVETDAYTHCLIARLIVSWNLDDEQGRPLPLSQAAVALLEPEDGEFLAAEVEKRRGGRPAAQQAPFKKLSGQPSTATTSATPRPGA